MLGTLRARCFEAFTRWVIRHALRTPYTHLRQADGRPYMDRYWLFKIGGGDGEYPLLGARVHHIQSSDDDRAFHDHPWPFISIILRGGYRELRRAEDFPDEPYWHRKVGGEATRVVSRPYGVGDVLFRRATTWHLLHLKPGQEAVTLFITLPRRQDWGFLWKRTKVAWQQVDELTGRSGVYSTTKPGGRLSIGDRP